MTDQLDKQGIDNLGTGPDRSLAPESGDAARLSGTERRFLIQEYEARQTHFDFRLEFDGVMKGWAVPHGLSMNPSDRRIAVRAEDQALECSNFDAVTPESDYGAGMMQPWDAGTWKPLGDPEEGFREGKLTIELCGKRIEGAFALIRLRSDTGRKQGKENWLLVKQRDRFARGNGSIRTGKQASSARERRQSGVRPVVPASHSPRPAATPAAKVEKRKKS